MDKWQELKNHLIEQLHIMYEEDERFEGYLQILGVVQDLEALEISNNTHGQSCVKEHDKS